MNSFSEMNNLIVNNLYVFLENDDFIQKDVKLVTSAKESLLHNVNNDLDLDLSLKFNFELEDDDETNISQSSTSDEEEDIFCDSYENRQQMEDAWTSW